jgi:hypothetical protein
MNAIHVLFKPEPPMNSLHSLSARLASLVAIVSTVTLHAPPAIAHDKDDGPEVVEKLAGAPGHTVWKITRPRVTQARTEYPQITFSPNSQVTVTGSGCVQTGGKGATWKRYVDPAGAKSSTLYHGEILIPGAMPSLKFFEPRQPTVYTIPAKVSVPAGQMHLTLGYTDDAFSDNGYYARNQDNGNYDQCLDLQDASVTIDIGPAPPPVVPPASASYTLTLDNVTIRHTRSRKADTDVVAASALINGTPSAAGSQAIGDLKVGSHPLAFQLLIDEIAPSDRIDLVYTIVNAGNPDAQGINDAITGIIGKIGSAAPGPGSLISGAASAWSAIFKLLDPDCDGPVVADAIMVTGSDLATRTQSGPWTRTISFVGVDSATGCGENSFYEVTYSIAKSDDRFPRSYAVKINARSHETLTGNGTALLRPKP